MKLILGLCLMAATIQAKAATGFLLGMTAGGAMASGNNQEEQSATIDLTRPTIVCMAGRVDGDKCATKDGFQYIGTYVRQNGYGFYRKRAMVIHGIYYYIVLDVWN